jgi:hypothetical protein
MLNAPPPAIPGGSLRWRSLLRWCITIPSTTSDSRAPTTTRHTTPSVDRPWGRGAGAAGAARLEWYRSRRSRATPLVHPKPVWMVYSPPPPARPPCTASYCKARAWYRTHCALVRACLRTHCALVRACYRTHCALVRACLRTHCALVRACLRTHCALVRACYRTHCALVRACLRTHCALMRACLRTHCIDEGML